MSVEITSNDFNVGDEYRRICADAGQAGAVVFFVGLVRELYDGETASSDQPAQACETKQSSAEDKVTHLELTHYAGMTETQCQKIIKAAQHKFGFEAARIVHRVGKLEAGDQIVFVAVASRHRTNAFQAAQYIMDYLKTEAPIWKKEVGARGSRWLGLKQQDVNAAKRWQPHNP